MGNAKNKEESFTGRSAGNGEITNALTLLLVTPFATERLSYC